MKGLPGKSRAGCIVVIFTLFFLLGMNGISVAENRALEQLLELLEANGSISPQQANKIKSTIGRTEKGLQKRRGLSGKRKRPWLKKSGI